MARGKDERAMPEPELISASEHSKEYCITSIQLASPQTLRKNLIIIIITIRMRMRININININIKMNMNMNMDMIGAAHRM
jgi:hypothetical protein